MLKFKSGAISRHPFWSEACRAIAFATALSLAATPLSQALALPVVPSAAMSPGASIDWVRLQHGGGHYGGHHGGMHRPIGGGVHRPPVGGGIHRPPVVGGVHPGYRPGYRPGIPGPGYPGYRPGYPGYRPPGVGYHGPVIVGPGYRPVDMWWQPGGAIAAGVAIGVISAAAAAAWAGKPPGPNYCWYYTDASRRNGFWDLCRR
jgi:hypothetical protein